MYIITYDYQFMRNIGNSILVKIERNIHTNGL